jgi:phenylpropionate dioxygenase-like ring-hydroxylating dioxygenase large terminal subunit
MASNYAVKMPAWHWRHVRQVEKELVAQKSRGVLELPRTASQSGIAAPQPGQTANDIRLSVPPLGLREYWYPALPAKKVNRKPLFWVMLGDELVLFRNKQGEIVALSDVCPHRGASLSEGACFYRGYLSCPYHGATFDGQGECVAYLTEGPDSKMVGNLRVRVYPTKTLRDWVFVWMGDGEPAPIEEDVPPEFFESGNVVLSTYTYWSINWLLAVENHSDSHNAFYVHRNSIKQLLGITVGRNRTPIGPQSKIVNGRGLVTTHSNQKYYAKDGKVPYQMYYSGVDGVWPLHRWRLLWQWFFQLFTRNEPEYFKQYEEWGRGHHLPSAVRTGGGSTRFAVPVRANLSRIIYFYFPKADNPLARLLSKLSFTLLNSPLEYNFSNQDGRATASCRFWTPEHFAPTDAPLVVLRKLVTEQSRDAVRRKARAAERERSVVRTRPQQVVS